MAFDPGNKSKPIAIRIKKLPKGSIKQDQVVSSQAYTGTVVQDQPLKLKKGSPSAPNSNGSPDTGIIKYSANGKDVTIPYMVSYAMTLRSLKVQLSVIWG